MAWFTHRSVDEAKATSAAALAEAEATRVLAEEARFDRELAWRPILVTQYEGGSVGPDGDTMNVNLTNVGNGPALNCQVFCFGDAGSGRRGMYFLSTGQSTKTTIHVSNSPAVQIPTDVFSRPDLARRMAPLTATPILIVATCSDALGRRWRFFEDYDPESVGAGDPNKPDWAI